MRFVDRVVIVTGAGYGIGKAIAEAFAHEGARVVLAGRSREKLAAVAEALSGKALAVPADVRDEREIEHLFSTTEQKLGRLDVLVNNAGIAGPTALARDVSTADWEETLRVNLTGAFLCARRASATMVAARRGSIVNISSISGRMAHPMRTPYAASKWGMIGLSHSLAAELGPYGIRVNAVLPGATEGERIERIVATRSAVEGRSPEEVRRGFTEGAALKRMVMADEVARAVLFLASDDASGVTGQAFSVCAGSQMR